MEALVGNTIARILTDKGCRGHNAPPDYKFRIYLGAKARRDTADQARIAPHGPAWVATISGSVGDANNAILAAAGYFRRLICWLRLLLCQILSALLAEPVIDPA
jgi:IS5 family transposase